VRRTMAASKFSRTSSEPLFRKAEMAQGRHDPSQELDIANDITSAPPRGSQKTAGALGKGTVIASASEIKLTEIPRRSKADFPSF
jgi:hypothetical protein